MIYNLISNTTGKTVGYITVGAFDTDRDIPDEDGALQYPGLTE